MKIPVNIIDGLEIELLLIILILGLSSYRVSRIIVQDEVMRPVREWVWRRWDTSTMTGYFFTCYSCVGFWVAIAALVSFILWPVVTLVITVVLAISAIVVIIDDLLKR